MELPATPGQDYEFWYGFIELYRNLPVLWIEVKKEKPKHLRDRAYNILLRKYRELKPTTTVKDIKNILKTLRLEYRKELRLALKHEQSASHEVYESLLWCFEALNFLRSEETESLRIELKAAEVESTNDSSRITINDLALDKGQHIDNSMDGIVLYCKSLATALSGLTSQQYIYAKYHFERILNCGRKGKLTHEWPQIDVSLNRPPVSKRKVNHEALRCSNEGKVDELTTEYMDHTLTSHGECLIEEDNVDEVEIEQHGCQISETNVQQSDGDSNEDYTLTIASQLTDASKDLRTVIDIHDMSGYSLSEAYENEKDQNRRLSTGEPSHSEEHQTIPRRQCTMHTSNYVEKVVQEYSSDEFLLHFRVGRDLVQMLCHHLEETTAHKRLKGHGGYEAISARTHILAFLWFLGHDKATYRDVAERFNLSVSCLHDVIWRVSDAILDLESEVIVRPTGEKKAVSETCFSAICNIPGVIGCVGGTQIKIDKPIENAEKYLLRKGYYSMQLQAIINEDLRFVEVFVEYPGEPELMVAIKKICGEQYCLLGNSAYPCLTQLLVPYRSNDTPPDAAQKAFNEQVERVTGRCNEIFVHLKRRFRQVYQLKGRHLSKVVKLIKVCCILHNLATADDMLKFEAEHHRQEPHLPLPVFTHVLKNQSISDVSLGQEKRDAICASRV